MEGNNYDTFAEQSRIRFLTYDQSPMIPKFHLDADEEYLCFLFLSEPFRIVRETGLVEREVNGAWEKASVNDIMTVYDMLCLHPEEEKLPELAGEYASISMLGGIIGAGHAATLHPEDARAFSGKISELKHACEALGGTPAGTSGDVSYILPLFDFFPVWFQFWDADEEFPAQYQFLFDKNALRFLHYETIWYAMESIRARLISWIDRNDL